MVKPRDWSGFLIYSFLLGAHSILSTNSQSTFNLHRQADSEIIQHNIQLNACKIQANTGALYICNEGAYVTKGSWPYVDYSHLSLQMSPIIDGDLELNNIVLVNRSQISILQEFKTLKQLPLINETPILARIKTRNRYLFVAIVSQ